MKDCSECIANVEIHFCPFQSDINNNDEDYCHCCDECTERCAQDI